MSDAGPVVIVESVGEGTYTQRIQANGHWFLADEPPGTGDDAGPTPYELLLAALGACTSMTLTMYAKHKGLALEGVSVRLEYNRVHVADCEDEGKRKRVHRIQRDIRLDGRLSDAERERLRQIAERCPVHRTLVEEKEIVTRLA